MASKVAIANFAISGECGADEITALTDNTKQAKKANLLFDDTAREVMAEGEWTSATFRQTLAQDATAPTWGFNFRYTLPTDPEFLGLLEINETAPGNVIYRIESGFLLTDESSVNIKYKGYQTDTEAWDMHLQNAFVKKLAHKLCWSLTGNIVLRRELLQEYLVMLSIGQSTDGLNNSVDTLETPDLTEVR